MDDRTADVRRSIEYSRDRLYMERGPAAIVLCLAGLVFVVYFQPRPPGPAVLAAFLFLVLAAAIVALAQYVVEQITQGRRKIVRLLAATVFIGTLVVIVWREPGEFIRYRRVNLEPNMAGWLAILIGIGWIAFALYRHIVPAKPVLALSPAGMAFHVPWLRNLVIPWHVIEGVDALEYGGTGTPNRFPDTTVVLLPKELYERDAPIEARWRAFKDTPPPAPAGTPATPETVDILGVWTIDGSLWQTIKFLLPLLGIVAVLLDSSGVFRR